MMDFSDIERFLHLIGAKNVVRDESGGWVRASCPLAPWTHAGGSDAKPSFGVRVPTSAEESPNYHCFTCQARGILPGLLGSLSHLSGDRMEEAHNFLSQFSLFPDASGDGAERGKKKRIRIADRYAAASVDTESVKSNVPVPPEVLQKYPLLAEKSDLTAHAEALRWLAYQRNISLQSIAQYQLRLFVNTLDDVGVIFPIIDRDGETVLDLWARMIGSKHFFRVTCAMSGTSVEYKAPNLMFGNHLYDRERPLMLVEGALDALRLHSLGVKNVMATLGALSADQLASLYAPVVYLAFDSDGAGREFTKRAATKLDVPSLSILDWEVAGIKDAGELENLEQFKKVFDARTKILKAPQRKPRTVASGEKPSRMFLKDDGTFL